MSKRSQRDEEKRTRIPLDWYASKGVLFDVQASSRKLKGSDWSPKECLFRTHQYEFVLYSEDQEFAYPLCNYFARIVLLKKVHHNFEPFVTDDGTTSAITSEFSGREGVLRLKVAWPDESLKLNFRGIFCFCVAVYRDEDEDRMVCISRMVSNVFTIYSKPEVWLKKKADQPEYNGDGEIPGNFPSFLYAHGGQQHHQPHDPTSAHFGQALTMTPTTIPDPTTFDPSLSLQPPPKRARTRGETSSSSQTTSPIGVEPSSPTSSTTNTTVCDEEASLFAFFVSSSQGEAPKATSSGGGGAPSTPLSEPQTQPSQQPQQQPPVPTSIAPPASIASSFSFNIQVAIKNTILWVTVNNTMKVGDLKALVQKKAKDQIPSDTLGDFLSSPFDISFCGRVLSDGQELSNLQLGALSVLHVLTRPKQEPGGSDTASHPPSLTLSISATPPIKPKQPTFAQPLSPALFPPTTPTTASTTPTFASTLAFPPYPAFTPPKLAMSLAIGLATGTLTFPPVLNMPPPPAVQPSAAASGLPASTASRFSLQPLDDIDLTTFSQPSTSGNELLSQSGDLNSFSQGSLGGSQPPIFPPIVSLHASAIPVSQGLKKTEN